MIQLTNKLYGASLFALAFSLNAVNVNAQTCTTAPSCEVLGFTKSVADCKDRTSLKCPFDQTKYFCLTAKEEEEALGGTTGECEVGAILYSDKTCSTEVIPSKVAIGIVFDKERSLAMALEQVVDTSWTGLNTLDVPSLRKLPTEAQARADFEGKTNTGKIKIACDEKYVPTFGEDICHAIFYVTNYSTEGTNVGDWYLPALGKVNEIWQNKDVLNSSFNKLSSATITVSDAMSLSYRSYCSSSDSGDGSNRIWVQNFSNSGRVNKANLWAAGCTARPVLAF